MPEPRRIRVVGKQHPEPDLKALARAVIELARLLDHPKDGKKDAKKDASKEETR